MSTGPTSVGAAALLLESPRLISVDEYHRMIESGILGEDERVELLEGVILALTPQSPSHARRIQWLNRHLARALGDEFALRPQLPLTLRPRSEPEPDLAVVRAEAGSEDRHPETAVLVIEVASASLRKDRGPKAAVYARTGIPEYWIVTVEERTVEVASDPDPGSGGYRRWRTFTTADRLECGVLPQVGFAVAELFG